jgi:hypothetical protein
MIEEFYDMHPQKSFHKNIYSVVLLFGLIFCSPSFAETAVETDFISLERRAKDQFRKEYALAGPDYRLNQFKQKIGYDEAVKNEERNGLIEIDFRKLKAPPFATQWPAKNPDYPGSSGWSFTEREFSENGYMKKYFEFSWAMEGREGSAYIVAWVFSNYEHAQRQFIGAAKNTTMAMLPWVACEKGIGTICARSTKRPYLFFTYKNVFIKISGENELITETMAEWLFEALKAAPLRPFSS